MPLYQKKKKKKAFDKFNLLLQHSGYQYLPFCLKGSDNQKISHINDWITERKLNGLHLFLSGVCCPESKTLPTLDTLLK